MSQLKKEYQAEFLKKVTISVEARLLQEPVGPPFPRSASFMANLQTDDQRILTCASVKEST